MGSRLVALGHPVLRDISASLHTKPLVWLVLPEIWERLSFCDLFQSPGDNFLKETGLETIPLKQTGGEVTASEGT